MKRFLILLACFLSALNAEFIGEASYGYSFYKYEEPNLMKIQGTLHEVSAKVGYMAQYIGVEVLGATTIASDTKYDGSTMAGTPVSAKSKDSIWSVGARLGLRMDFFDAYDGLLYTGFYYRYLNNLVQNEGGYTREQTYYSIPIGFHVIDGMGCRGLFARYGAEVQWIFLGQNKTHIGTVIPSISSAVMEFEQRNAFAFKAHFGFEYRFDDLFKLFAQANVAYYYIQDSNSQYATYTSNGTSYGATFYEPRNNTLQAGIEIGLGF